MNSTIKLLISDIDRFRDVDLHKSRIHLYFIILRYIFTSKSFRAIYFYRVLNSMHSKGSFFFSVFRIVSILFNSFEIPYTSKIGEGLSIPHAEGIFINKSCIIGKNATILQGVTLGGNIYKEKNSRRTPLIGDNVLIGAGAKILGPVTIGDNSMIGANAVVVKNIPPNSVAVGIPAKVVKKVKVSYIEIERYHRNFKKK